VGGRYPDSRACSTDDTPAAKNGTAPPPLAADGDDPAGAARGAFVKILPLHIDTLSESVQVLRARLAKAPQKDGLATAEYAIALYERADAGDLNPARVNFRQEFAASNAILGALDAGKHGDSGRAYRSAVDAPAVTQPCQTPC
jgi:hypothetical protein